MCGRLRGWFEGVGVELTSSVDRDYESAAFKRSAGGGGVIHSRCSNRHISAGWALLRPLVKARAAIARTIDFYDSC